MRVTLIFLLAASTIAEPALAAGTPDDLSFFPWDYWEVGERSETFRNLALAFFAFIGLGFGIWRAITAHRQTVVAEQGLITDRFSKAVEHLGGVRAPVRIGGLYALKRIAEDSPERDHLAVMDVLTNYIRHPPYAKRQRKAANSHENALEEYEREEKAAMVSGRNPDDVKYPKIERIDCPDIVAAIEIIQSRTARQVAVENDQDYVLTLSRANLSFLRLIEVDLHGINLSHTNFRGADLGLANLKGADLSVANLTDTFLGLANLTGVDLNYANLKGAVISGAKFMGAKGRFDLSGCFAIPINPPTGLPDDVKLPKNWFSPGD